MAIKPILLWGDAGLTKTASHVPVEDIGSDGLDQLVHDMFDTMRAGGGIGLAAPQIGVPLRLFVMDVPGRQWQQAHVFINPVLVETIGPAEMMYEGCLSLPGVREQVKRYREVTVVSSTESTIEHWRTYTGIQLTKAVDLEAQCCQHEIEHLDGHLFVDDFKPMKLQRLREQFRGSVFR